MSTLADVLEPQLENLVQRWTDRLAEGLAPEGLPERVLRDHIKDVLRELVQALRHGSVPDDLVYPRKHGKQRYQAGFDLEALVREYGVLRGLILELSEEARLGLSMTEIRLLTEFIASAIAEGVSEYDQHRQRSQQALHDQLREREAQIMGLLGSEQAARAEAEAAHHRLERLIQNAPAFIATLHGPTHRITMANGPYRRLVGAERALLDLPVAEALPEVVPQGFIDLLDTVYRTGRPHLGNETPVRLDRQGQGQLEDSRVNFLYQPTSDASDQVVGIDVFGFDVTSQVQARQQVESLAHQLRLSEERYRSLFEAIDDGFCLIEVITDPQGVTVDYRYLEANAAFTAHTGLAEVVGKSVHELVPSVEASWFQLYGAVADTGQAARFENYAAAMGRWFDIYANRVGPAELRQVAVVFKDITARKKAEAERERLLLLESVARQQAEEASRLKDEFLATISHELRTPLTAMLGWVQMLRSGMLPPDRRERALETIERNAKAQAQLIEDLLDMSRIMSGKLGLEIAPLELVPVVEAALETVRPAAEAKGIRLHAALDPGGLVMGDPHRLQQVVWNLLSNAIKFTPRGGQVRVALQRVESSVELTIADTGQGIAQDFQPHIFERFRQADGGTSRAKGGLGLGLSIVQQLVELHGGTVRVFSEGEGLGTIFTVSLPLAVLRRRSPDSPGSHPTAAPDGVAPGELAGLRLLVVDDEEDTREMLAMLLEAQGAEVRQAASAAEGRRQLLDALPDVLLSDIGMPGENGYAFLQSIRAWPREAGGKVLAIALTAYARSEDRTQALAAGFSSHVAKPIEPRELTAVILSLVRHARLLQG